MHVCLVLYLRSLPISPSACRSFSPVHVCRIWNSLCTVGEHMRFHSSLLLVIISCGCFAHVFCGASRVCRTPRVFHVLFHIIWLLLQHVSHPSCGALQSRLSHVSFVYPLAVPCTLYRVFCISRDMLFRVCRVVPNTLHAGRYKKT